MATFPGTPETMPAPQPLVGTGFPQRPPTTPGWGGNTFGGNRSVSNFAAQPSSGNLTLDALVARQKAAMLAQERNMSQPQGTILGGLGTVAGSIFNALDQRKAEKEEGLANQEISNAISSIGPDGIPSQEVLDAVGRRDKDTMLALLQMGIDQRNNAATLALEREKIAAKDAEDAAPKQSDISSMRGQVMGDESYTALVSQAPIYGSMLKSAGQNDRTSDLDMISGLAKMIDPTGVVRGEDVNLIVANQPGMEVYKSYLETFTTDPNARLKPEIRKDIMRLAYDRISGNYDAYENLAGQFRQMATENGWNPKHVAPVFPKPTPWGAEPEPVPPEDAAGDDAAYPG